MANIGFRNAGYALRTELNGKAVFSKLTALKQGIKMEVQFDKVDTYLSAFDQKAEIDKYISGATLNYESGYLTLEQEAELLGHNVDEVSGVMTVSIDDVAPEVAFYAVAVGKMDGVKVYDAYIFLKGVFGDSDISMETADAGGSINYGTKAMSGTFTSDALTSNQVYLRKVCNSQEEAMTWVNEVLGATQGE